MNSLSDVSMSGRLLSTLAVLCAAGLLAAFSLGCGETESESELNTSEWGDDHDPAEMEHPEGICRSPQCADCVETLSGTEQAQTLDGDCLYRVASDVQIASGDTLTIEPGAVLVFTGLHSIEILGTLDVRGSESDPVYFTSDRKTVSPGDWAHLYVSPGSVLRLSNAVVEGFSGIKGDVEANTQIEGSWIRQVRPSVFLNRVGEIDGAVDVDQNTDFYFDNSTIEDVRGASGNGIYASNLSAATVTDSVFEDVTGHAVNFDHVEELTVQHNGIYDNGAVGRIHGGFETVFEYNDVSTNDEGLVYSGGAAVLHRFDVATNNNFIYNGEFEVLNDRDFETQIDASSSFWGDGVDPANRVNDKVGSIDVSNHVNEPIEQAGPRR